MASTVYMAEDGLEYFEGGNGILRGYECATCDVPLPYPGCPHGCDQDDPGFEDNLMREFLTKLSTTYCFILEKESSSV